MYDAIYFSPHLDDVVLSCGGQIYQRTEVGESVLVVTITAGETSQTSTLSEFAEQHHESWELDQNPVAQRKLEDITAVNMIGADHLHLDVLDCIYRLYDGKPIYQSDAEIFGDIHFSEQDLLDQLAEKFAQLPHANQWVIPLAVGDHVDHQLTRLAAEAAAQKIKKPICYYEDYPYVSRHNWEMDDPDWMSLTIPLNLSALVQRTMAILAYESQVNHLFGSSCAMEQDLVSYIQKIDGERLWRPNPHKAADFDIIDDENE